MDISRDELRRTLRAADRDQQAAIPRYRAALARILGDPDVPAAAKAEILGVPARRQFLRIGGSAVLGAAVLAACSTPGENVAETGTTPPATDVPPTVAPEEPDTELDLTLARTAASLENLAVEYYEVILGQSAAVSFGADITFDQTVLDTASLFRDHHQQHADAVNAVLTDAGEEAYTDLNKVVLDEVVTPALPGLTSQDAVVRFARDIENVAAGTYAYSAGALSTAELRQSVMSIGGVEARHAAALALILDPSGAIAVPHAFIDAGPVGRIPDTALVAAPTE